MGTIMAKPDVKKNLLEHSAVKVRLLGEYLRRYLNVISNDGYTEKIKIYDLFCGEGIYKNQGEGSPLVILRAVKDLHFINVARLHKTPLIDCYFNDIETRKIEKVKQAIKDKSLYYPDFGKIEYNSNDYKEEVRRLIETLPRLKNHKAFIFIDPYEYKHIKPSDIRDLLANRNTEVLLFLPTQFMYRFDANGTPEALKDFIEELVDIKKWKDPDSAREYIEQLKEAFRHYLGAEFFVDTFTIQKDSKTLFCLFFFCSHIKGFEKMLEAKWEIDTEQGKGWNYTNTGSLFEQFKTNPLEEKLKGFLKDHKRYNGELYKFVLTCGFLPKHANEVFFNWQNNDVMIVETDKGEKVRKGSFYIAYKYYRDEGKKVKLTLR